MNETGDYRCSLCGKIMPPSGLTHICVSTVDNPAEMRSGTCTVRDIASGCIFMTADGVLVLKSEYRLRPEDPNSPAMCIVLGSGEFFHGENLDVQGDDVQVWPIYIPIASRTWLDSQIGYLRRALQEIITKSFAWDDGSLGNWELERKRWHKLRNIAMAGLQNVEA